MARKIVDCRDTPSPNKLTGRDCTLVITGEDDEVLQAAVEHGVSAHGYQDTPELRDLIRSAMKDELAAV
jgi:predicted small metal-binding protein